MSKIIVKITVALLAALLVIQLVRVQLREEEGIPEPSGMSRVRVEEISIRRVLRTHRYTGRLEGIRQAVIYPSVPGVVKEKLKKPGDKVEKDGGVLLIDRYEEGVGYEYSRVRSPIAGKVLEIIPDVGERVSPQHGVASVADTSVMETVIYVPEEEASLVEKGREAFVRVKALEDMVFTGTVAEVEPALDRMTLRRKVRINIDNPDGILRPFMVCSVDLVVEMAEDARAVPLASVLQREGEEGIFIVDGDDYARWRPATVLLRGDSYAALEGDFSTGERVAVYGHFGLVPDRKVQILD